MSHARCARREAITENAAAARNVDELAAAFGAARRIARRHQPCRSDQLPRSHNPRYASAALASEAVARATGREQVDL